MKPIMELMPTPDALDYNQLKMILAIFEYEFGILNNPAEAENQSAAEGEEVASIFKRKVPSWIQTSATVRNSSENVLPPNKKKCHSIFN